jgi:hypothetical protein
MKYVFLFTVMKDINGKNKKNQFKKYIISQNLDLKSNSYQVPS